MLLVLLCTLLAVPTACEPEEPEPRGASGETLEGATGDRPSRESVGRSSDVFAFDEAQSGGTIVIGQGQEPDTLYYYGGSMLAGRHVLHSLYDGPIEGLDYDFQAVIVEDLPKIEDEGSGAVLDSVDVEAGDRYVDPRTQEVVVASERVAALPRITVRFTIRDGVTWQDGTEVTADDSVFSQMLACHADTPTSKFTCERTTHYKKIDDKTVEWRGLPGFTDQTYYTNFYNPLPRHQEGSDGTRMEDMAPAMILEDESFARAPWSYGPFVVSEWESGDHITLERNPNYWRSDEGLPLLDVVIHRFIPDSNALLASLKSGEIDVATQDGLDISQYDALSEAEVEGDIVPHYVVGTVWEHIDFNLDPVDERVPIGACPEVRRALITGTDRETMVDVIQKGQTRVQHTLVPQEHWAFPPEKDLVVYRYDPEAAKRMLERAGFSDRDGDGIREAVSDLTCTITTDVERSTKDQVIPAGTPLELTLNTTAGNVMREDTTLLFQQNMLELGVRINLEYLAANVYFEDGPDGPLFGRQFDLGEFAWLTGVQPPVNLYYCTEIPSEGNGWAGQNQTGWCDPDYDRLGKGAETTLEREDALPFYHEAQRIFMERLPVMPLFARVKVMAVAPDVVNFRPNATVNSETWNIEAWGLAGTR